MSRALVVLAVLALAVGGCRDASDSGFEPRNPSFEVRDAANPPAPDPLFWWLPPTVSNPVIPAGYTLKEASPVIWIACAPEQAQGITCVDPGPPNDRIPKTGFIEHDGLKYQHDWRTQDYALASFRRYRLTAMVGEDQVLGWLDVQPVDNPNQVASVPAGYYGFTNGSRVPLKFAYLTPAPCADEQNDCVETNIIWSELEEEVDLQVGGGHVKLKPGNAHDDVPRRWTLVRTNQDPCLVSENGVPLTRFAEAGDCFKLIITPAYAAHEYFEVGTAFWGQCRPADSGLYEKWKTFLTEDGEFAAHVSHGIPAPIPTEEFDETQCSSGTAGIGAAILRRLARAAEVIFATPGYARFDVTMHGFTRASWFTFARPLMLVPTHGAATIGTPANLEVRVVALHPIHEGHPNPHGVGGVEVQFVCVAGPAGCSGIGPFSPVVSNSQGYARQPVTFATAGTYTFCAWTPNDGIEEADCEAFTVTVAEWNARFLTPLVNKDPVTFTIENKTASGFLVIRCAEPGPGGCGGAPNPIAALPFTAATYKGGSYNVNWTIQYPGAAAGHVLEFSVVLGPNSAATPLPNKATFVVAGEPKYKLGSTLPAKWQIGR